MNRLSITLIEIAGSAIVALLIVVMFVPGENIMPDLNVRTGQTIYSLQTSTMVAVVTGYRIPVGGLSEGGFSPPSGTGGQSNSRTKSGHTVERAALSSEKAAGANSRTRPAPTVEQKRPPPSAELLNPYIIENIIKSSDKTYYFTEKSLTRSGVTVELLSMTPRKNDYFLKFRITNAGKDYFIPQAFAVKHGDDWVDSEKFFTYMLQTQESQIGYLRVKAAPAAKDKMFQLNESGGGFRKYSIFY